MKTKKSQEMLLSTVAKAAIVLGVLVVLFIIFTSGSQKFSKTINSCEQNAGECVKAGECKERVLNFECSKGNECCSKSYGFV